MTHYQRAQLEVIRARHAALKKQSADLHAADGIILAMSICTLIGAVIGLLVGWL